MGLMMSSRAPKTSQSPAPLISCSRDGNEREDDWQDDDVVHAGLYAQRAAHGARNAPIAQDIAQDDGIGGGQQRAEQQRLDQRGVEEKMGEERDSDDRQHGARAEEQRRDTPVGTQLVHIEPDRVEKEHQREAERRHRLQTRRVEIDAHDAGAPQEQADAQEDDWVRDGAAIHDAGGERRDRQHDGEREPAVKTHSSHLV